MLFLLLACGHFSEESLADSPTAPFSNAPAPRVILLVMDGVRVEECVGDGKNPSLSGEDASAFTPEMHATLFPEAAVVHGIQNAGVTTTYDAHVELMSGLRQPLVTFPAVNGSLWRSEAPTLFELLRQQKRLTEEQTLLLANTPLIGDLSWSLWPGLGPSFSASWSFRTDEKGDDLSDGEVVEVLKDWLSTHDTRLALVNLHQMDLAGHVGADYSYLDRIRSADPAVARLWSWLQKTPPYADHTTLLVLSDHGRHRGPDADSWRAHGDQCTGCRDLFLLAAGPGIIPGSYNISSTLPDVTATAANILHLPLFFARGRPLTELYGLAPTPSTQPGALSATDTGYALEVGNTLKGSLSPTPGLLAEAPVLLQTDDGLLGCWREWAASGSWAVRCTLDGKDTGFPAQEGSANWSGNLLKTNKGAVLSWVHNPEGYAGASLVRPRLALWDGNQWHSDSTSPPELAYPTHLSLSNGSSSALRLAVVSSDEEATGRSSRSISVYEVSSNENMEQQSWNLLLKLLPDANYPLLDHPAMRSDGNALAWFGIAPDGRASVLLSAEWSAPPLLLSSNAIPLFGLHWRNALEQSSLFWAEIGDGGIQILRWDGSLHRYPTTFPWITGISVTDTSVFLSTPAGVEVLAE